MKHPLSNNNSILFFLFMMFVFLVKILYRPMTYCALSYLGYLISIAFHALLQQNVDLPVYNWSAVKVARAFLPCKKKHRYFIPSRNILFPIGIFLRKLSACILDNIRFGWEYLGYINSVKFR